MVPTLRTDSGAVCRSKVRRPAPKGYWPAYGGGVGREPVRSGLVRSAILAAMRDRVVLITGATGPLGRAAAAAFAADGARLGLVGTSRERLDAMAGELALANDRWAPGVGDLRDRDTARAAIDDVVTRLGAVEILLHLVGGWAGGTPLKDLDPAVLDDMLGRHVWSTFHVVQAVLPAMLVHGAGRIVAVTSIYASTPGPAMAPYVAAKAAQEALLRSLARDVAGTGVTANLIAVKAIDAEHVRDTAPSPRNAAWTTPDEIVATIRFLCSPEAAPINGAWIPLDGR